MTGWLAAAARSGRAVIAKPLMRFRCILWRSTLAKQAAGPALADPLAAAVLHATGTSQIDATRRLRRFARHLASTLGVTSRGTLVRGPVPARQGSGNGAPVRLSLERIAWWQPGPGADPAAGPDVPRPSPLRIAPRYWKRPPGRAVHIIDRRSP